MFIAGSVLSVQPAAAANDFRDSFGSERTAAFGGVSVRVPLASGAAARPSARLRLGSYKLDSSRLAHTRTFSPTALELGASKKGKPMLFVGGQSIAETKQTMGLDKTTTMLLIGGVIVAVVIVAVAAGSVPGDTCPEVGGSRDHCINP